MSTVTTVIPAYNAQKFVAESVNSALAQTGVDNEVIVVDDGSTDDTPRILANFGDRIRIVSQPNSGLATARNNGAKIASGEWIAFLDADDIWLANKLSSQLAAADENVGMVYTNCRNFGAVQWVNELTSEAFDLREGDLFEPLLLENFIAASTVMMRTSWFEQLGGFDPAPGGCEDWDLWLRYSATGGITKLCREPLTEYRWHETSMTSDHKRMCAGRVTTIQRNLQSKRGQHVPRKLARQAFSGVWKVSAMFAASDLPWTAVRWNVNAAIHWPWDLSIYKQMIKACFGRQ